ncbi:methionine ABC transporter ATP-binding protein [Clostridium thermobutyricum]|uniref:Methionine ABC transporter ATP-binding protein n=1 Tax=Clostridium thermobutyricum TaxID=29372 RepID=N9XZB6_9CLOT|nr:methionine ABC transporter ATP-binding protein [Clostridium thermobutyricum]ENZ01234.1 methionine ABC transporter ATP-binding protein [Clostridium thermobutyricum]
MIKITSLDKSFGNNNVLKNISLEIKEGEIYGIIGHSGAGKSTLLRCINGLEGYNNGSLTVMGQEIKDLNSNEIRNLRRNLGMIFQNFNLLNRKTVFENIALPLEVWKYDKKEIEKKVHELLKLVGLEEKKNSKPKELSGGQKQRVAIARALALEPKILLCDEATSALDPKTTKDILELLLEINKRLNITIVMVTHQMEVVKEVCETVTLLDGGVVKSQGKAKDLFLKPETHLKKFLGEDEDNVLPKEGINIRIFFPSDFSENAIITKLARDLEVDFSIVFGKLEKFREDILGSLVINVNEEDKEKIVKYLENKKVKLEVL